MDKVSIFVQHHWLLCIGFVVILVVIVIYEKFVARDGDDVVSPHDAVYLINRENAVVLDVRRKDAFLRGHIVNSINIALVDLAKDLKKLHEHKDKPILVVCNQGTESIKASKVIGENDFSDVKVVKGGLVAWKEAKLPVEKGKGK